MTKRENENAEVAKEFLAILESPEMDMRRMNIVARDNDFPTTNVITDRYGYLVVNISGWEVPEWYIKFYNEYNIAPQYGAENFKEGEPLLKIVSEYLELASNRKNGYFMMENVLFYVFDGDKAKAYDAIIEVLGKGTLWEISEIIRKKWQE